MVDWGEALRYTDANVERISNQGGNYITYARLKNKRLRAVCVGKAQNLHSRPSRHLSGSELNPCIRNHISKHVPYFRHCYVGVAADRGALERHLYDRYNPECSRVQP